MCHCITSATLKYRGLHWAPGRGDTIGGGSRRAFDVMWDSPNVILSLHAEDS